jgi:hypothetical protein
MNAERRVKSFQDSGGSGNESGRTGKGGVAVFLHSWRTAPNRISRSLGFAREGIFD